MSCSAGQGPRMPGKIHRRKMLFGEMGFPDQVPKTRSTGAERFTRPRQLTSDSSALGDSGSAPVRFCAAGNIGVAMLR